MVSRIRSVSLWLPDPSQKGSRAPKSCQKLSKIDHFVLGFSSEFQWWIALKMLIPGSCWAMLWHVLLPFVLPYSQLYCSSFCLFRGVWALMLSSLSLCSPREWSLACLALSGPFATTGSGKRLLVRQLKVPVIGSLQGSRGGESERGRKSINLEQSPPCIFV